MSEHSPAHCEDHDRKSIGRNSPVHFQMSPKPSVFLKSPPATRINSPSRYVLKTHSHSGLFSQVSPPSLQQLLTQETSSSDVYKEHLFKTFQALHFIRSLRDPPADVIASKKANLPMKGNKRRTIVLDLDETLVHCIEDPSQADTSIAIDIPGYSTIICLLYTSPSPRDS